MLKKGLALFVIFAAALGLLWYLLFALKEIPVPEAEIISTYQYQTPSQINFLLTAINEKQFNFTYTSFDGATVNGRISYPKEQVGQKYPVLIGVSAMGRNYKRWWVDSYKERPTVTQVNKIGNLATEQGYVLISIDSRFHGDRKKPERSLSSIMFDLNVWGDKKDYQGMIIDTTKDLRVLLDWIESQPQLDNQRIAVAGYSMGAQISLLLSALDERISKTLAMVPPFIDDKLALVAPKNLLVNIKNQHVWLLSGNDDENASEVDNDYIYQLIPSQYKKHIKFEEGHILPEDYPQKIVDWLTIKN